MTVMLVLVFTFCFASAVNAKVSIWWVSERQGANPVGPLLSFGCEPNQQEFVRRRRHRKVLRDDDQTRACALLNEVRKVPRHCLPVVRYQDAVFTGRES